MTNADGVGNGGYTMSNVHLLVGLLEALERVEEALQPRPRGPVFGHVKNAGRYHLVTDPVARMARFRVSSPWAGTGTGGHRSRGRVGPWGGGAGLGTAARRPTSTHTCADCMLIGRRVPRWARSRRTGRPCGPGGRHRWASGDHGRHPLVRQHFPRIDALVRVLLQELAHQVAGRGRHAPERRAHKIGCIVPESVKDVGGGIARKRQVPREESVEDDAARNQVPRARSRRPLSSPSRGPCSKASPPPPFRARHGGRRPRAQSRPF